MPKKPAKSTGIEMSIPFMVGTVVAYFNAAAIHPHLNRVFAALAVGAVTQVGGQAAKWMLGKVGRGVANLGHLTRMKAGVCTIAFGLAGDIAGSYGTYKHVKPYVFRAAEGTLQVPSGPSTLE